VADVACVSAERDRNAVLTNWLEGSPELVIEIKSPSNDRDQLHDKAMTTLAGQGAVEFWIVDPESREVRVYTRTSGHQIYGSSSGHTPSPVIRREHRPHPTVHQLVF
jgi:Uma2 family endonuclease